MSPKMQQNQNLTAETVFRLRPLSACIRALITGGLFVGAVMPSHAELPIPIAPLPVPFAGSGFVSSGSADWSNPNKNTLKVNQHSDKAILNWHGFDVGKGNTVKFDQPNSSSIALNRINEDTNASHILGTITANGQIYLVNKNGFVFHDTAVVNTSSLVASALNISYDVFTRGIIREFEKNSAPGQAALNGQTGDPKSDVKSNASIIVNAGAKIHAGKNGSVILAAPNISNSGSISGDQNAQIILVASQDKVYLQPASKDSPFAGLLVEVGKGGSVENKRGGDITTRQGNITLAGFAVNQSGRITATTSVDVNGSVRLLAREEARDDTSSGHKLQAIQTIRNGDTKNGSSVTFGNNSSVKILPDANSGSAIDEQAQKQSYVEVSAHKIQMQSGSAIVAPSAQVNFTATDKPAENLASNPLNGTSGRIFLDGGSRIDVSGTKNTKVPIERNVAEVSVQTFNLRNSPYQKAGILQGKTVKVDIRKDTKIFDSSGGAAGIKRSIDERLAGEIIIKDAKGNDKIQAHSGEINLTSSGDVVVNKGAVTDISGGFVKYKSGYIDTTKLMSNTGRLVDISDADPNESYVSIFGTVTREHPKWGPNVTETWNVLGSIGTGHIERGYTEGKAGGGLNIQSPLTSWNGDIVAGSVSSIYQRNAPVSGGSFSLNSIDNVGNRSGLFLSSQNVLFQTQQQPSNIDFDKPFPTKVDNKPIDLMLQTALINQSGLSNVTVKTGGKATITNNEAISMPPGLSEFSLDATSIDVNGIMYSPGGTINLNSVATGLKDSGNLNLAGSSILDVSGRWINDFQKSATAVLSEPIIKDGGKVILNAGKELNFNQGAVITADGGAWLDSGQKLTAGKAGEIKLVAGNSNIPGLLHINGSLSAYSLNDGVRANKGGSLTLAANKINIGSASGETTALNLGVTNGNFDILSNAGFSDITLQSNRENITVKSNTDLNLIAQNRVLTGNTSSKSKVNYALSGQVMPVNVQEQGSAKSIAGFTQVLALPEYLRAPGALTLNGKTGVTQETGGSISVDKASTINISTSNIGKGIYIDGMLNAPGGNINLFLGSDQQTAYDPKQSIWLGSHANLITHGTSRLNPLDAFGRTSGDILSGGNVSLTAQRGYIVLEEGSKIDVSGTSARLDIPIANKVGLAVQYVKQNIGSDAGKIEIKGADAIILDGELKGKAGASNNRGGRLDLTLDRNGRNEPDNSVFPTNALQINVIQNSKKELPINLHFGSVLPTELNGNATVASDELGKAGIDELHLNLPFQNDFRPSGEVRFLGDVNLKTASSIFVDAQKIGWSGINSGSTGTVNIDTAYLQLGSSTIGNIEGKSQTGGGKLTTNATWTQLIGAALLTGFNQVNLNSTHDLRAVGVRLSNARAFTGNLNTAANLNLNASQIYPSTLTNYTFAVTSPTGQLTIDGQNTGSTPLSAAGQLTFMAPVINQNGVLKAPLGTIELDATTNLSFGKGSLTSVSADGKTIPLGIISNNVWEYPLLGNGNLVFNELPDNLTLGEKHLVFTSPDIQFKSGSVVDVSGGGDIQAAEFQPGLGGDFDYLVSNSKSFAILPSLGPSLAPYDHRLSENFNNNHVPGAQVYLAGTKTLPAGKYTILPSQYALLPGAYLVTPQKNTQDQINTINTKSGLPIVSGYQLLAGTNMHDSRLSGFLVENRNQVRKHSEYDIQTANNFFAQHAASKETAIPLLPADSGQISIDASTRLILDGQFKVAAQNGRGAKLDISAKNENIDIVNQLNPVGSAGTLQILDQQLSKLHVDSLLLGGTRQFDNVTGNTNLTVTTNNVTFNQGTHLQALDLVAAGKNSVVVKSGANISSSGTVNTGESKYNIVADPHGGSTDSALLRVSADKQITVSRDLLGITPGIKGDLLIEQGAVLSASKSMLLDASKSTVLNGDIAMKGGALSLTANDINIGEFTGQQGNSLNLSSQKLTSFTVDDLVLKSRGSINFFGNVGKPDGSALQFNNLALDAKALSGYENTGKSAKLQANNILVENSSGIAATQLGTGTGTLGLIANQYNQGGGTFGLDGFSAVNIAAAKQFTGTGNSTMNIASDLNLTTGLITTTGGHSLDINAIGHNVTINGNGNASQPISNEFGGRVSVDANSVALNNAHVLLPSGALKLTAQIGDILVNGKTDINLAGRAVGFADIFDYTPGGTFSADAKHGLVALAANTNLDVSTGGGAASGGNLIFKAPEKTLDLLGNIKATGASANIDVAGFSLTASFDSLMNKLTAAGVSDSLYFRTHNADIIQAGGNEIKANSLTLVADKGAIDISGKLNADRSKEGGVISLYAGDKITLENGALLTARGNDKGGKVLLSSVPVNPSVPDNRGIEIKSGSTIDVSGSSTNSGGLVTLSALRTAGGINIKPIAGTVQGYSQFFAEGVKKYNNADLATVGQIGSTDITKINGETASYMTTAAQNVSTTLGSGIRLRPGVEVDYTGDLTLANAWDFSTQRFGQNADTPGSLIITTSGKLNVNSSITDGFQGGALQTGDSWSFQLVSGADQTSADKFATTEISPVEKAANPTAKDLTIGSNASVHTGTGDIKLASGGNFKLFDQTSTVYNVGRADVNNRYGTLDGTHIGTGALEGVTLISQIIGEYPIDGGELVIRAGADIKGAVSNQFLDPWLQRQGHFDPNTPFPEENNLTTWAVDASQFQQNIGSFGGGRVDISSGGNMDDLSVMLPTTGKQQGLDFNNNIVQINGGGQMRVNAGGNISGGAYFLGKGEGNISAGGEIKGSNATGNRNAFKAGPQIILSGDQSDPIGGNSKLTLTANQGIKVGAVSDAMVLSSISGSNQHGTKFFSYSDKSNIGLKTLSGDIHLGADTSTISGIMNIVSPFEQILTHVYPGTLNASAFNGSVHFDNDIILFPSAVSNVDILAKQDINSTNGQRSIIMSDADLSQLPNARSPLTDLSGSTLTFVANTFDTTLINNDDGQVRNLVHAIKPVHADDKALNRLVTQNGDISSVSINFPKQSIIQAGRDLINTPIKIQQINQNDASIISAGRDLRFTTSLTSDGNLDTTKSKFYKIEIAGPGDTSVKTGRDLDLGSSVGLSTVGNLFNATLPSKGTSLDVLVGLSGTNPDYAGFISKYQPNPLYAGKFDQAKILIAEFMRQRSGNAALSVADAFNEFKSLKGDESLPVQAQLNALLSQVFFNELKVAGSASADNKSVGNKGGYDAIAALFPGNHWKGDLSLFYSKLQTVSGGDINLYVPGGKVNAGLAVAPSGISGKTADDLGIVAQREGQINAFVKDDFIVNTSRVFTLAGGDILIWSSEGNIDAGKGAKSALSVTVEAPFFDKNDQLVVPAPKITNGSGIRTASTGESSGDVSSVRRKRLSEDTSPEKAGDVFLFAPQGIVDAGEAGIAGNNVTISATAVLGANNIQVGGISAGVPQAPQSTAAAGLTGTSNLSAGVTQVAEASMAANNKDSQLRNAVLGLVSVDILGFGENQ